MNTSTRDQSVAQDAGYAATLLSPSHGLPIRGSSARRLQQPHYDDADELAQAAAQLAQLPPLVTSWEVLALKQALAEAQEGRRFLLQGGDCAESFADCTSPMISNRLKVLLQMSLVLVHGLKNAGIARGAFCRAIRQAAFDGYRNPRRRDACRASAATWSTARNSLQRRAVPIRSD